MTITIKRAEDLTQIYATTTAGREVLLASKRGKTPTHCPHNLYDRGNGETETSTFVIGISKQRSYKLAHSPQELCSAFEEAGMKVPGVKHAGIAGRVLRKVNRAFLAVENLMDGGKRSARPS